MSLDYYVLNDDSSINSCTIEEWGNQNTMMRLNGCKTISYCVHNGNAASTVWIGIDLSFLDSSNNINNKAPHVFETMIFDESGDSIYCDRYSTWDDAQEGHKKAVAWLKNGCEDE